MYEYGVPVEHHLALPAGLNVNLQFPLAIGTIGDFAAGLVVDRTKQATPPRATQDELVFAAQVLVAMDASQSTPSLASTLKLLAAAAFYLSDIPGTALAVLRDADHGQMASDDIYAKALLHLLQRPWNEPESDASSEHLRQVLDAVRMHFLHGTDDGRLHGSIRQLRSQIYSDGSPHELLFVDVLSAVALRRVAMSSWSLLPRLSNSEVADWHSYLTRPSAVKEVWPSQRLLGKAGLYNGSSSIVQMPTSAGKTRAIELIIRSSFIARRTSLALVIAPFRALCHEIANELSSAFAEDDWIVNRLRDALQPDYVSELAGFLQETVATTPHVVVLTPEKLLYILRQEPAFVARVGLIVYDEGHQFDTGTRGITYELLLTSVKRQLPNSAQSILISAVIKNSHELAAWLLGDARQVVSDDWLADASFGRLHELCRWTSGAASVLARY